MDGAETEQDAEAYNLPYEDEREKEKVENAQDILTDGDKIILFSAVVAVTAFMGGG